MVVSPKLTRARPCALPARYVSDATVAIFVAALLFVVPSQRPQFSFRGQTEEGKALGSVCQAFLGDCLGQTLLSCP